MPGRYASVVDVNFTSIVRSIINCHQPRSSRSIPPCTSCTLNTTSEIAFGKFDIKISNVNDDKLVLNVVTYTMSQSNNFAHPRKKPAKCSPSTTSHHKYFQHCTITNVVKEICFMIFPSFIEEEKF